MKAIILILALATLVYAQHGHGTKSASEKQPVWLDTGLGNVEHPVTTKNAEAQKYFNQGLAYMFAFNHAEGINSFKHAAELDPELAMAYWGIALGLGSNYNVTADEASLTEAYANLQKAEANRLLRGVAARKGVARQTGKSRTGCAPLPSRSQTGPGSHPTVAAK